MKRLLCMLLALTMLSTSVAFATEDELIVEDAQIIMVGEERRSQWTPSEAIVQFIANQEGFRSMPHKSGGYWYIGYGTQIKSGQYSNGISREKALELLMEDINYYVGYLDRYLERNGLLVTRYEYDALLSLTYNVSTGWMKEGTTLNTCLTGGVENYTDLQVVNAFGSWCRAGGKVLSGLARRRIEEAKIFLYGDYGDFNYDFWYAPDEKDLQLESLQTELVTLLAQLESGVDEEGNPYDEEALLAMTDRVTLLPEEIEALQAEIEAEDALKVVGPYYPDGTELNYTYVRYDAGKGTSDKYIQYYQKGVPYGEFSTAERSGYQLAAWETEDGERLLPTDCPTGAKAVKAVWTKGDVDHRNLSLSPFADVAMDAWYYDELKELSDAAIIGGYDDGTFRPNDAVTCGAALKLILLSAGYEEQAPTDESSSFSGYLTLALREGLVEEGEITNLRAPANRLLVARLTAKAMGLAPSDEATPYADADDAYATALFGTGIMAGKTVDGVQILDAASNLRRCEAAAVLWRMRHYGSVE